MRAAALAFLDTLGHRGAVLTPQSRGTGFHRGA
jgi:hypothetical protein